MTGRRLVVVDLEEDNGELYEELYENQPDRYRPITRDQIRIVIETLVALEYDIVWYDKESI